MVFLFLKYTFELIKFERPVVLKVAHKNNHKILRSSTRASALKIENFIVEATF
jgi:hypothetical protein